MPLTRATREQRAEAGVCVTSSAHGPATHGRLCASCRARARLSRLRRLNPEAAVSINVNGDFWAALRDLWYAGKLGMGR
jgi:hypothetical protein